MELHIMSFCRRPFPDPALRIEFYLITPFKGHISRLGSRLELIQYFLSGVGLPAIAMSLSIHREFIIFDAILFESDGRHHLLWHQTCLDPAFNGAKQPTISTKTVARVLYRSYAASGETQRDK
jgi:hypothetical protein